MFEYSLSVGFRSGQVADGGECEGGPVERAQIFSRECGVLAGSVRIDPVALEALDLAQKVVETAEPVREDQQDVN